MPRATQPQDDLAAVAFIGLAGQPPRRDQSVTQPTRRGRDRFELIGEGIEVHAVVLGHQHQHPQLGGRDLRLRTLLSTSPQQDQRRRGLQHSHHFGRVKRVVFTHGHTLHCATSRCCPYLFTV